MGLSTELATALSTAFATDLADAVKTFTYVQVSQSAYNPVTGVVESAKSFSSKGIFDAAERKAFPNVSSDDITSTLIVLAEDMPIEPNLDDLVVANSKTYGISGVTTDPVDAVYMLALKRQGS